MQNTLNQLILRSESVIGNTDEIKKVKLPALREVLGYVTASRSKDCAYTKHSAHTKTSTGGCVMGCIGG